ncbi:hypothetical protein EPO05_00570 [Patescibacteria group bacterium]|nr:MAG: hypothetical protein EPO05_00570 [Patescibacteria group bacterium]
MNKRESKSLQEIVEEFRYSDNAPATAAKFLLMTLALGSVVFAGALIPALFVTVNKLSEGGVYGSPKFSKDKFRGAVRNLKHRKLIEIIREKDGKTFVRLTKRGEQSFREFYFDKLEIKKPNRWDKKWRVLIFDIPTNPRIYNKTREALRFKIKMMGFRQLQKSVWIHPYPCEDEVLFLAGVYNVERFIEILTVDQLLHEKELRVVFKL